MALKFIGIDLESPSGKVLWIDGRFLNGPKNGIARDTNEIIQEIREVMNCTILPWPSSIMGNSRISWKIFTMVQVITNQKIVTPPRFKGTLFQPQLGPLLPGVGMFNWVVRLHDIFPATNPEWFRRIDAIQFKKSLNLALNRGAYFICDSESTQNSLFQFAGETKVNSTVRYCKALELSDYLCQSCLACKRLKANAIPIRYFLTVGTIEPRKNYEFALNFWKTQVKEAHTLIIVGRPGWKTNFLQLKLKKTSKSVLWLNDVCDGALKILYAKCVSYISFSLNEGFNLPAMEASQLKVPLILSDIPVHRELHFGNANFYRSSEELEAEIGLALKNPGRLF